MREEGHAFGEQGSTFKNSTDTREKQESTSTETLWQKNKYIIQITKTRELVPTSNQYTMNKSTPVKTNCTVVKNQNF